MFVPLFKSKLIPTENKTAVKEHQSQILSESHFGLIAKNIVYETFFFFFFSFQNIDEHKYSKKKIIFVSNSWHNLQFLIILYKCYVSVWIGLSCVGVPVPVCECEWPDYKMLITWKVHWYCGNRRQDVFLWGLSLIRGPAAVRQQTVSTDWMYWALCGLFLLLFLFFSGSKPLSVSLHH